MALVFVHLLVWFGLPIAILYLIIHGIIKVFELNEKSKKEIDKKGGVK